MAIDSAQKRDSAMLDFGGMPWPPDSTSFTADRRLIMLEFYSGIEAYDLLTGAFECGAASIRPTVTGGVAIAPSVVGKVAMRPTVVGSARIN